MELEPLRSWAPVIESPMSAENSDLTFWANLVADSLVPIESLSKPKMAILEISEFGTIPPRNIEPSGSALLSRVDATPALVSSAIATVSFSYLRISIMVDSIVSSSIPKMQSPSMALITDSSSLSNISNAGAL